MPKRLRQNANADLDALKARARAIIVLGMADTIWAHAFRSWGERELGECSECGSSLYRVDGHWVDDADESAICPETGDAHKREHLKLVMEKTPPAAFKAAADLAKLYESAAVMGLADLWEWAMTVHDPAWEWPPHNWHRDYIHTPHYFGYTLARQAMEDGVFWGEDHQTQTATHGAFDPGRVTFACEFEGDLDDSLTWTGEVVAHTAGAT